MLQPPSWKAEALYEPTVSEGDILLPLVNLLQRYINRAERLSTQGKDPEYYLTAAASVKGLIDGQ